MKIYIINGQPTAGKSTFCNYVKELSQHDSYELSTVDKVKDIARYCGWNGTKDLKNRKFLSDLKDILSDWKDLPVQDVLTTVKKIKSQYDNEGLASSDVTIFINCREPEEICRLCNILHAQSILIKRQSILKEEVSNHADENVFEYDYDIEIKNNGDLRTFAKTVIDFLENEKIPIKNKNIQIDFFGKISYN